MFIKILVYITKCTFTIESKGDRSLFKLKHVGWERFPEAKSLAFYKGFTSSWQLILEKLKAYAEQ